MPHVKIHMNVDQSMIVSIKNKKRRRSYGTDVTGKECRRLCKTETSSARTLCNLRALLRRKGYMRKVTKRPGLPSKRLQGKLSGRRSVRNRKGLAEEASGGQKGHKLRGPDRVQGAGDPDRLSLGEHLSKCFILLPGHPLTPSRRAREDLFYHLPLARCLATFKAFSE